MDEAARAAWLEARRSGIGGSDIAAVAGLSPWKTPYDVWLEKVGLAPPQDETEPQRWGHILEPIIAKEYAARLGVRLRRPVPALRRDRQRPWMIGTADFLHVGARVGMDAKAPGFRQVRRWGEGAEDLPDEDFCQAQWYLALYGYERWDVAPLLGRELRVYPVVPKPDLQAALIEAGERFWLSYVVPRTPPPADASASARRMLEAVYPAEIEDLREASLDEHDLAVALFRARATRGSTEEAVDLIENRLREAIGEAQGLSGAFGKVTWKKTKDGETTDWQMVAKTIFSHIGGTASQWEVFVTPHTKPKPGVRRFLPAWAKGYDFSVTTELPKGGGEA